MVVRNGEVAFAHRFRKASGEAPLTLHRMECCRGGELKPYSKQWQWTPPETLESLSRWFDMEPCALQFRIFWLPSVARLSAFRTGATSVSNIAMSPEINNAVGFTVEITPRGPFQAVRMSAKKDQNARLDRLVRPDSFDNSPYGLQE